MSQRWTKSIPTMTYVAKIVQYAPKVVLPTQVYTKNSGVKKYWYGATDNFNITQTNTTTTTNVATTTNKTTYTYPHSIYYFNPQYSNTTSNNPKI